MRLSTWRKCRVCFRWLRISILLVLLAAVCALLWFNQIGLPDFLKNELVEKIHAQGIELQFSRLHLSFVSGLVADNVRLQNLQNPANVVLTAQQIRLHPNFHGLLRGQLELNRLDVEHGKFVWPVSPTNALALENIQAAVRFQKNDDWSLDNFQADFDGVKLAASGDVAHAREIRDWKIFSGKKNRNRARLQAQLQKFSDTLKQIHFAGASELSLTINGDARDLHSFAVRIVAQTPSVQTPWFAGRQIQLLAKITAPAANAATNADSSWGFWTNLEPYRIQWSARLQNLESKKLKADSVLGDGFWQSPEASVRKLSVKLADGGLEGAATLNVATRELTFTNVACFDFHAVSNLLSEKTRARLAEISWERPPLLHVNGSLILPAWTIRPADWRAEVPPTISLAGEVAVGKALVHKMEIDRAQTDFTYQKHVWDFSDFSIARGNTRLEIDGSENEVTKNYRARLRGTLDPEIARPFLTASNAAHGFAMLKTTEPLALDMNVSGRLNDYKNVSAQGRVALTNFVVRGQPFDDVTAVLDYTNRVLEFGQPLAHIGAQTATADKIVLNFNTRLIFFTNGLTQMDVEKMARAIGPKVLHIVTPYHFLQPPRARVNGQIPLRDLGEGHNMEEVDMRFDIWQPAAFRWLKLKTPAIMGTIHWQGKTLALTNVTGDFYGGSGNGFANFDFRPAHAGADYQFTLQVTNVDLHLLAKDLAAHTNHLEGTLAGKVVVTYADTRDLDSWNGFGRASLRNGLLWDIPIFGILSPMLNGVSPGLGNSRARAASAKFAITNGVIFTDTLEIRSLIARLNFVGTVNFHDNVNAVVSAQLLRDTWAVGPLISTVFWPVSKLFEYHITGTLKNPKADPVYVPKILLMPLHPLRSLEQIFPAGGDSTNAPAQN